MPRRLAQLQLPSKLRYLPYRRPLVSSTLHFRRCTPLPGGARLRFNMPSASNRQHTSSPYLSRFAAVNPVLIYFSNITFANVAQKVPVLGNATATLDWTLRCMFIR